MMSMLALAVALAVAQPLAATPPADDAGASPPELQQMYDQSCAAREYGAYDDLCDQLSHQLKDAQVEAARDARRKAAEARRHPHAPSVAPSSQAAPAPAPSSASPSASVPRAGVPSPPPPDG